MVEKSIIQKQGPFSSIPLLPTQHKSFLSCYTKGSTQTFETTVVVVSSSTATSPFEPSKSVQQLLRYPTFLPEQGPLWQQLCRLNHHSWAPPSKPPPRRLLSCISKLFFRPFTKWNHLHWASGSGDIVFWSWNLAAFWHQFEWDTFYSFCATLEAIYCYYKYNKPVQFYFSSFVATWIKCIGLVVLEKQQFAFQHHSHSHCPIQSLWDTLPSLLPLLVTPTTATNPPTLFLFWYHSFLLLDWIELAFWFLR